MKIYKLNSKNTFLNDFNYAYSAVHSTHNKFNIYADHIANFEIDDESSFSYISLISKEKFSGKVKLSTKCSFCNYGAPLIVLSNDLTTNEDGTKLYGAHYEIVAYEDGCNIWYVVLFPENTSHPIKSTRIGYAQFKIEPNTIIDISAEIDGKKLTACINGHTVECFDENIPYQFCAGLTACEGPNRFYEFSVEKL